MDMVCLQIFPHHENEIAQSQACACDHDRQQMGNNGTDFVRFWLHNGFVNGVSAVSGLLCMRIRTSTLNDSCVMLLQSMICQQPMHPCNKVSFMQYVVTFIPAHCGDEHPQSHASSAHSSIDMAWMIGHYCCCHHTPSGCFQLKLISSLASACAVDSEKMSKSLGNFFTIRDVTAQYHPLVLRWFLLNTQYRQPINYSQPALDEV